MAAFERIIWIVLDSVGIGELPDAADYDDVGRNTLGHIAKSRPLALPNLVRLGLGQHRAARLTCAVRQSRKAATARARRIRPARTPPPGTGRWRASGCRRRFPFTSTAFRAS